MNRYNHVSCTNGLVDLGSVAAPLEDVWSDIHSPKSPGLTKRCLDRQSTDGWMFPV